MKEQDSRGIRDSQRLKEQQRKREEMERKANLGGDGGGLRWQVG
uniref:Small VCP/p97-interacting protein n=1 Tax=Strigamia maritima TaxID=126957 RepID=T1IGV6_STRMM